MSYQALCWFQTFLYFILIFSPSPTPDQRQQKSDTYTPRHQGLYPKAATQGKISEDLQAPLIKNWEPQPHFLEPKIN